MLFDRVHWANPFVFLLAGILLTGSIPLHTNVAKKRFQIEEGSRLYLKGTSNVNSFTCDCGERYAEQMLEVDRNGGHARFNNVHLLMKSKLFDCHNRKIDNDMQKALQADRYPHIKIALLDSRQQAKCLDGGCKDWFDVQAKVNITITKVTKELTIAAQARMIGPDRFELRGEQALQMSAFGIDPPEAMFGMIKVHDWITFHFNLIVRVGEGEGL